MPKAYQQYLWLRHAIPVMLLAGVIRFYNFGEVQLTNDELSAWARLDFNSLEALLKYGVQGDAHPALTHMFLWFWTGVFGDATWVIKMPFVLMSLGGILILYRLCYEAFGRNTADLTGVILAAGQMFPVFALQARPYAMGFLICSALAWIWFGVVSQRKQGKDPYIWLGCLLALAVYTHYFAGLLAVVVWVSGWVFYKDLNKKWYLISALIGTVLFLPHLQITLGQMGQKGIGGWLAAPRPGFLLEWVQGLFNYHTPSLLIFGTLLLIGFIRRMKDGNPQFWILPAVFTTWFLVVYGVGHAYSLLVDPLLHHGSLFFAAPFAVVAISAIASPPGPAGKLSTMAVAILLAVALVFDRDHYTILKTQPYASTVESLKNLGQLGDGNVAIIAQGSAYLSYYEDPKEFNIDYINQAQDNRNTGELINLLIDRNPEYFFTDGRRPSLGLAAAQFFNHVEEMQGFTFTGQRFSNSQRPESPYSIVTELSEPLETTDEFIPVFTSAVGTEGFTFADEIGGLVHFAERPAGDVTLVVVFSKGEETVQWTGGSWSENGFENGGTPFLPHQVLLWNYFLNYHDLQEITASIYLWNPDKVPLKILKRQAYRKQGNPNMYGQLIRRP